MFEEFLKQQMKCEEFVLIAHHLQHDVWVPYTIFSILYSHRTYTDVQLIAQ